MSMKTPVEIDLRIASFTLFQFGNREELVESVDAGLGTDRSSCSIMPLQIMTRASLARVNCDWEEEAILSRSLCIVSLPESPFASSLIVLTSFETWTGSISGKLRHENECLCIFRR